MHLGIDLGTTRTVVATADRGNYPVVGFTDQFGDAVDHVPSVVAAVDGRLVHGFDAVEAAERGAPLVRSFKGLLAAPDVGPHTLVRVGDVTTGLLDLMTDHLAPLLAALRTRSSIGPQLAGGGRLARGFGVFREGSDGAEVAFDPIFSRDDEVPAGRQLVLTRRYRAAHTVGCFRFVEFGDLDVAGQPTGDISPFGEIVFPFDRALQEADALPRNLAVERIGSGPLVEERYTIDANGLVEARITDLDTSYTMVRALGV